MQTSRGRRRAAGPPSAPRVAEVVAAERPRDLHRDARRRRGPFRQMTEFAAASGIGQKAGIALAATGLVLTVTMPATSPVMATDPAGSAPMAASAVSPQPRISADVGAQIDFSRSAVVTEADPDGKLKQLLSAQSAGSVTRAA